MVSFTTPTGSIAPTTSRREITTLESADGLNRSATRCRNRRLARGSTIVSFRTIRRNGVVAHAMLACGPISSRMFLSSSPAVELARMDCCKLIVRRSLSFSRRVMLSSRSSCKESSGVVSARNESIHPRTVRSSLR